jgi:hypothetical protein
VIDHAIRLCACAATTLVDHTGAKGKLYKAQQRRSNLAMMLQAPVAAE